MMKGNPYTQRWLAEYPVSRLAARICMSALEPLGHLHEKGVIHRDVKTKNLVMSLSGRAALVDLELGLSEEKPDFQPEGKVLGTADYMAPERACGHRGDARTDIYAMGIVLYELLFGRLPFSGEPRQVAFSHIVDEIDLSNPERRPIPDSLISVIKKATQKNRADRYQSAGAMREAIAVSL
jgi:serine/threonine-protein kinase